MRKTPRFKIYTKSKLFLLSCPKKILKFKKSKWLLYKNLLKKTLTKRFFFNFFLTSARLRIWEKKKLFFKQNLLNQRYFLQLYDNYLKSNRLKKEACHLKQGGFQFSNFLKNSILKFEFKLAVLLVRLKFFFNVFDARKNITAGNVLVNNFIISSNYSLKEGDIIKFKNINPFNKKVLNSFFFMPFFISFVEIDYYLNQIIIVKNLDCLSSEDTSLLMPKHFNLSRLRFYYFKN